MNEWINNPLLENMNPAKLELIRRAAAQTSGKSGKELAPIMMALITSAMKNNIHFSPDEVNLILELLKDGKSTQEKEQIDHTKSYVENMMKRMQK